MNENKLKQLTNEYINDKLLSLNNLSREIYEEEKLREKIVKRLFLRRFRKYAISPDVYTFVENKINNIINKKLDMVFVPSFGGYKHWWTESYPACDWAEVFNMKFMLEYLAPIINSYDKGKVKLIYESEEVILSELNNVPQSGLDLYTEIFRKLAAFFNDKLQNTTSINLVLAREQYYEKGYTKEDLLKKIEEMYPEYEERFNNYDEEDQKRRIRKAETNFKLDGNGEEGTVDYTGLSAEEKYELYKKSRILNETFLDADYEFRGNDFFEAEEVIPLLFSFGLGPGGDNWLHIGSCSSSMVDFWSGIGILVLEEKENGEYKFIERIISKSQYDLVKDQLVKVSVESGIKNIHSNFEYIYVFVGKLNF